MGRKNKYYYQCVKKRKYPASLRKINIARKNSAKETLCPMDKKIIPTSSSEDVISTGYDVLLPALEEIDTKTTDTESEIKTSPALAPVCRDESSSSDVEVPRTTDKDADGRSHEDVCCECGADVEGFRYVCVQCSVSLCGACAARGAHPTHYVLRLPHHATPEQTDAVLSLLRAQLGGEAGDASIKFEIKEEPVDHLTDAPSMEDDNPASQDFEIFVKEEPLQEPMDEAANLQAAIMNIKKENEAIAESEYPSVESSFSVHTHSTKPNEPLIKDSAPQQLTTLEVLEPIGSQYEIEIRNEPNQVCVPGTSSQQRTKSYETYFFSKNPTKRTVPPENILLNKITKTSASVNKERKKPIVQKLVKKKVTKPMKNVNSD